MPDFPLHPTLFFSLSIVLGLVLSYFFTVADLIDKKDKKFIIVNLFLYGSWTVAAIFAIYIVHLIEINSTRAVAFAPLGMMIAALIASASVMKNIAETKANEVKKNERESSKFHLDKCTEGIKHFYDLLKDGNNDRATWLQASRILLITQELSQKITESEHKNVYEIEVSKTRFNLYSLFKNPINGYTLNERFFFGGDQWKEDLQSFQTLAETKHFINTIEEYSATAIFKFLDYPENFSDPLHKLDVMNIDFNSLKWQSSPRVHLSKYIIGLEKFTKEQREKDQQ